MDVKRTFLIGFLIAIAAGPVSFGQDQVATDLKAIQGEIKAQSEKIDRLAEQVSKLAETLKQSQAPKASLVETPAPSPTPTGSNDNSNASDSSGPKTHVVAKGETLIQIAKQYGVPVDQIEHLNKIGDAKKLQAGQTIKIPSAASPSPKAQ
ncbi:MAG: LysM peptidoglycan-binding domain-containing protein [Verrucomicrobia bacterium]|nr:LysM peptidoglycan-binding domain-containing protein [Verrucomicrobiota bacterium]